MRQSLLKYLVCPACRSDLNLLRLDERDGRILEGLLVCAQSRHVYPIVRAIPRLLSTAFEQEADFSRKYREVITSHGITVAPDEAAPQQRGTQASFGREWTTYQVQRPEEDESYFRSKTGIDPASLTGKVVLDAGCGSGRYARVA